jgi:hypothetical protein
VRLRNDTENTARVNGNGTIVEPPAVLKRRANKKHRRKIAACPDNLLNRSIHALEKRVLPQKVVDRVARDPEFREHHEADALGVPLARLFQCCLRVEIGIADLAIRRAGRDADKTLIVNRIEIHQCLQQPSA